MAKPTQPEPNPHNYINTYNSMFIWVFVYMHVYDFMLICVYNYSTCKLVSF